MQPTAAHLKLVQDALREPRKVESVLDLIGRTPVLEMCGLAEGINPAVRVFAKLEGYNPGGSVNTPPSASGNLAANILLGRPTADSITANLYAQTDLQVAIAYGTVSGSYTEQTKPIYLQANRPQNTELIHLSPNTTYYYQVITDGTVSEEHTFHTQRAPGSTFTFTIDSDPHNRDLRFNGQLYANTLTNAR